MPLVGERRQDRQQRLHHLVEVEGDRLGAVLVALETDPGVGRGAVERAERREAEAEHGEAARRRLPAQPCPWRRGSRCTSTTRSSGIASAGATSSGRRPRPLYSALLRFVQSAKRGTLARRTWPSAVALAASSRKTRARTAGNWALASDGSRDGSKATSATRWNGAPSSEAVSTTDGAPSEAMSRRRLARARPRSRRAGGSRSPGRVRGTRAAGSPARRRRPAAARRARADRPSRAPRAEAGRSTRTTALSSVRRRRLAAERRIGDRRDVAVVSQLAGAEPAASTPRARRPGRCVSLQTSCCIASSGVIQGPPLDDQPGQLCIPNSRPRRAASRIACCLSSSHSGPRYSTGPFGMPVPASKLTTPPSPARFIASRSSVIPSRVTCPFIQNQSAQGRAESGGSRKRAARSAGGSRCRPRSGRPRRSRRCPWPRWTSGTRGASSRAPEPRLR